MKLHEPTTDIHEDKTEYTLHLNDLKKINIEFFGQTSKKYGSRLLLTGMVSESRTTIR